MLVALLDGSLQVYLLGTSGLRAVLLLRQWIRLEASCAPLPLGVRRAVLAENGVGLLRAHGATTTPVVGLLSLSPLLLRLKLLLVLTDSLGATLLHVQRLLNLPGFLLALLHCGDAVAQLSALGLLPVVLSVAVTLSRRAFNASLVTVCLAVLTLVAPLSLALGHDFFEAHALVLLVKLIRRCQRFVRGLGLSLSDVVACFDDLQRCPLLLLALLSRVLRHKCICCGVVGADRQLE